MTENLDGMVHITIEVQGLENNTDLCIPMIKEMYQKRLKFDRRWHFFREFNYLFLRVSNGNTMWVEQYLCDRNIRYTVEKYEENIKIAKEYLWYFIEFFHLNSILSVVSKESDIADLLSRVSHCFVNTMLSDKRRRILTNFHDLLYKMDWDGYYPALTKEESAKRMQSVRDGLDVKYGEFASDDSEYSLDKQMQRALDKV